MSTERPSVGIVTGEAAPELTEDGRMLTAALEDRGVYADAVQWTTDRAWDRYDAVLVRSCWEYPSQVEGFRAWLDAVAEADVQVFNPVDVLRWNHHKFYLRDLEQAGVDIVDTAFLDGASERTLPSVLDDRGWTEAVRKPAVGTSSEGVERITAAEASSTGVEEDTLIQRFAPEVAEGERSLVFLGGEFSHGWLSVPAEDDFRTHSQFGGRIESFDPPAATVESAREVLETAATVLDRPVESLLYARVDGITREGQFCLLELELIEPYLGLQRGDAVETLASAAADRL